LADACWIARRQTGPDLLGRVFVLRSHPVVWADLAVDLIQAETELKCLMRTMLRRVQRVAAGWSATFEREGGTHEIECRAIVDCSGDATVAQCVAPERSDMAAVVICIALP